MDTVQSIRNRLSELQIEVQSIGQNVAIVTKTINNDIKSLSEALDDVELDKKKLEVALAEARDNSLKSKGKKEPEMVDDVSFKGGKQ
ncbi:MAG: hypothetical protein QXL94_00130 [Candidatus Parvarchaeum sp.]